MYTYKTVAFGDKYFGKGTVVSAGQVSSLEVLPSKAMVSHNQNYD